MINFFINIDKNLTFFLKSIFPQNYFFKAFFSFLSLKGVYLFIWGLIIIFLILFEEKKNPGISRQDKQFIILLFLSLIASFLLVNFPLKNLFHRPRPVNINCPTDFSFPSGHAAISFSAAAILTAFDKKRKHFYYFIASLIAFSRIYLGCHFFLDVFTGGIIGYLVSAFFIRFKNLF